MHVLINGETKEIPGGINVKALLELLSLPQQRIAIEINRDVIRRDDWEAMVVDENDRIEIIHFVGGG